MLILFEGMLGSNPDLAHVKSPLYYCDTPQTSILSLLILDPFISPHGVHKPFIMYMRDGVSCSLGKP